MCGGLRNVYDIAFNEVGDMFGFDADMEFDAGTPWYRPCRINHLVSGGEYGWRSGSAKWPEYYADSLGAVVNVGFGSPTGAVFGSEADFPAKYCRAMFVGDWAYGRILAVHPSAQGASYRADFEVFLQGKPLAVTDLVVHPDGSLYFLIGGRKTQSGIYRITYEGDPGGSSQEPDLSPEPDTERATGDAGALRKRLEQCHGQPHDQAVALAWPLLNSPDRYIRYAARIAIESQPLELWQARALSESRPLARIQVALALSRVGDKTWLPAILTGLNQLSRLSLPDDHRLEWLRAYGLAFSRFGPATEEMILSVRSTLEPLFPASHSDVNKELCRLLVYLKSPTVVDVGLASMLSAETQEAQMFYAFMLRLVDSEWSVQQRRQYFSWLRHAYDSYDGGKSFQGFVSMMVAHAKKTLNDEERASVRDTLAGHQEESVIASAEAPRRFVHNWQESDLVPTLPEINGGRSFFTGEIAYHVAQCYKCHRLSGRGGDTGPDLTGVGNRFSPAYLLQAVLSLSAVIPDAYRTFHFQLADGRAILGKIVGETDDQFLIRPNPFSNDVINISKSEIEDRFVSDVSEMPEGLLNVLEGDEIVDLLAYLRSGGDANDSSFVQAIDSEDVADASEPLLRDTVSP